MTGIATYPLRVGRPPKPTTIAPPVLARARRALAEYTSTRRSPLSDLDNAVLAVELSDALEFVARDHVARAHEADGATWEQIGAAFATTAQSAHERFRQR
jgi:hypothetical protein